MSCLTIRHGDRPIEAFCKDGLNGAMLIQAKLMASRRAVRSICVQSNGALLAR